MSKVTLSLTLKMNILNQSSTIPSNDENSDFYLEAEPFLFDKSFVFSEDGVLVEGFFLPPKTSEKGINIFINDVPFHDYTYPIVRKDVSKRVKNRQGADLSGFELRINREQAFSGGHLKISIEFQSETGLSKTVLPYHAPWYIMDPKLEISSPDDDRRFRVIGGYDIHKFHLGGLTDYKRLESVVETFFSRTYNDMENILDWGCGCGRTSRYFKNNDVSFYGADVDPDNIKWCDENLLFGNFRQIPLRPKTNFESDFFDLIFGISVFTHLREDVQKLWLEELCRITRKGGVVLMTIHGLTTLNYSGIDDEGYDSVLKNLSKAGFLVTSGNIQIDEVISEKDYYVNVMHTHEYINRVWSEHFEIIQILPGYIFTHDLVVMRKR